MGSKLLTWCERHVHGAGSRPRAESARLEQVTVVIPSYGRQDFLLRQLSYWSDRKARVVIVDGSPRPFDVDTLRLVAALPSITYVHAAGTIGQRLKIAADLVETPYAVLSGDDEFLLTRGLARAIDKLDAQSDLVACIGQSIGFYPSNDGRSTTYAAGYPHWRYEVLQDTARARLVHAMGTYNAATCYAVIRRPAWVRSWGAILPWSSPYATELQQAIAVYSAGKLSTVDDVYWMRSFENPPVRTKAESNLKLMFIDWWTSQAYAAEREQFVEVLASGLSRTGQAAAADANQIILEAVDAYLALCRRSTAANPGVLTSMRSRVSSVARGLLPATRIAKVKGYLGIEQRGNLGTLSQLRGRQIGNTFQVGDELADELTDMEALVTGFWEARLGG